jgi:hypothetical protein
MRNEISGHSSSAVYVNIRISRDIVRTTDHRARYNTTTDAFSEMPNVELTGASQLAGEASVLSPMLGAPLRWKIEGASLVIELPFACGQLCVYLADPTLPVKILLGDFMSPEGIDIHYSKCSVFLLGDFYFHGTAVIVDQIMSVKETLPVFTPPFPIKAPHDKDPLDGIMGIGCWREWPSHIRVDDGQEEVGIFCVPTFRFEINHLLNFFRNRRTHESSLVWCLISNATISG